MRHFERLTDEFRFHQIEGKRWHEAVRRMVEWRVDALQSAYSEFWRVFHEGMKRDGIDGDNITSPIRRRAVCALINNDSGQFLAVSRKHDPNDFGLPGGKIDPGETDEEAIVREVREETGLAFTDLQCVFVRMDHEFITTTYTGRYSGEIHSDEEGRVAWVKPAVLTRGSFGDYNLALFSHMYGREPTLKDTNGKPLILERNAETNRSTSLCRTP